MLLNNNDYIQILEEIKVKIKEARYKAALGVNQHQIMLYLNIGNIIVENNTHGSSIIENLSRDIKSEFPNTKGYSARNLSYMQKFAITVYNFENLQRVSANLTWSHIKLLLDKTKSVEEYAWYAEKTIKNGWSLKSLEYYTATQTYKRQTINEKTTNYELILPDSQSKLAIETLKSPYVFDFIDHREGIIEREIENELVANMAKTLIELGTGFAFLGNQYHIAVSGKDYYLDLLFYNTKLHCYVVIELKNTAFKPEYAGKLNFYLSAVDDTLRNEQDASSIGILLCKERDKLTVEYALRDINKPIGVSEYKLSDFVPEELADTLPTAEDIELRIRKIYDIDE